MNKIIKTFIACLSFFIFYLTFSTYSFAEKYKYDNYGSSLAETYDLNYKVYQISLGADISESIEELISFADSHKYIIKLGITESLNSNNTIDSQFIYDPLKKIALHTVQGKEFSFSNNQQQYLSTNKDDKRAYDFIDFVDKRNAQPYQTTVRFYPLSAYKEIGKNNKINNVYFYANDTEEHIHTEIMNSTLKSKIDSEVELSTEPVSSNQTDLIIKLLFVCVISIILGYNCFVLKKRKEIAIRKLFGNATKQITKKLFGRKLLENIVLYVVIQFICFVIFVHNIRSVVYPFVKLLGIYFSLFLIFQILTFVCMYYFVKRQNSYLTIKQTQSIKRATIINLCIKFAVIVLILPMLINFFTIGVDSVSEFYYIVSNKNVLKNMVYINSVDDRQNEDINIDEIIEDFCKYAHKHGAVYQNFEDYEAFQYLEKQGQDSFFKDLKPYIIVNKAYLDDYTLHDVNGNVIDINNINKETIFVPSNIYEKEDISMYCKGECNIVEVQSGNTYWNQHIHSDIRKLKDPYVVYEPNPIYAIGSNSYYLLIDTAEKQMELQNYMNKSDYGKYITFQNTSNEYDIIYQEYKDDIIFLLPLFITYIFVILIFIYQNVYLYFIENRKKFAIEYLLGMNYLQRHGDIIYKNILVYAPILLFLYFMNHISWKLSVICILISILFEFLTFYVLIRKFENKRIIEILKGE